MTRKTYPSDCNDEEWAFAAPYLTLIPLDAPQRKYELREVYNALRYMLRTGTQYRFMPHDLPPGDIVQQQAKRWIQHHCFENMVHDLREILRLEQGKKAQPTASIIDSRFASSTPESGSESAYNGAKKKSGMKVHAVVDTLGHLMALCISAGNVDDRAPVEALCEQVQTVTGQHVEVMFADGGYTGETALGDAEWNAIELVVVKRPEATKGFVLLPKRWVVERSFAWVTRFRRLARDLERLPSVFAGLHWAVFGVLMLAKLLRGVVTPT
jgi:transposase